MHTYVIALDQGTTSSRAVLFDENARIVAMKSYEFEQIYPQPGWVEHDPTAILNTQIDALREVVRISGAPLDSIAAIGMTNQRETTLLWDRKQADRCTMRSSGNAAGLRRLWPGCVKKGWKNTSGRRRDWCRMHIFPAAS